MNPWHDKQENCQFRRVNAGQQNDSSAVFTLGIKARSVSSTSRFIIPQIPTPNNPLNNKSMMIFPTVDKIAGAWYFLKYTATKSSSKPSSFSSSTGFFLERQQTHSRRLSRWRRSSKTRVAVKKVAAKAHKKKIAMAA